MSRMSRLAKLDLVLVLLVVLAIVFQLGPRLLVTETSGGWVKDPGRPVIGGDLGSCFDLSVLKDGDLYRAWFSWRPRHAIAYTQSANGVDWSPPLIVLGPTDSGWEQSVNRPSVIQTADGFAMWYTGQTDTTSAIGYATSPDGLRWTRAQAWPVLSAAMPWEKKSVMSPDVLYDPATRHFRLWYSAGDQYEPDAIGYATSWDGIHWDRDPADPIFRASGAEHWDGYKVTAVDVEPYGTGYAMFYIGFSDMDHAQIGLAYSPDGVRDWARSSANPIIRPGNLWSWDADAVYKPAVLHASGRWELWYNGRSGSVEQIGRAVHEGDDLGL